MYNLNSGGAKATKKLSINIVRSHVEKLVLHKINFTMLSINIVRSHVTLISLQRKKFSS